MMKRSVFSKYYLTGFIAALMAMPYAAPADDTFNEWSRRQQQWKKSQSQSLYSKVTDGDQWDITVGAGVGFDPKYEGSDKMDISPVPIIEATWNNTIFLGPDGVGASLYQTENMNISASIGYGGGRDESQSNDLRGLGDIDNSLMVGLNLEYDLGPVTSYLEVTKYTGGTHGLKTQVGMQTTFPVRSLTGALGANPLLSLGISTDWTDDNYTGDYFGVNAQQSVRSGLKQYSADAGFKSVNAYAGVTYPITEKWSANATFEYSRMLGDAADSPIVKKRNQLSGAMFLAYRF